MNLLYKKKDAIDDVQGAQNAGMNAILVRTGKYRQHDEEKICGR